MDFDESKSRQQKLRFKAAKTLLLSSLNHSLNRIFDFVFQKKLQTNQAKKLMMIFHRTLRYHLMPAKEKQTDLILASMLVKSAKVKDDFFK